jgi:hypothetical protein
MSTPFEIFATGAVDVYLAVTGTADPVINVAPPGAWIKVGVAGKDDYSEDGVRVTKTTENNEIYANGLYGVRKVFRTREKLMIAFTLMDATIEAYRDAWNQTAVTTIVGPPAEKTIPILENVATPTYRAMLLRAPLSPYMAGGNLQWWIPLVYQTGSAESAYKKSDPVGLALEFTAIADATSGFGKLHAQTS